MIQEFRLPDLGEGIEAGDVVRVLVAEGDTIRGEQPVVELETDKAVVEVPCPLAGKVVKVHVRQGEKVKVGAVLVSVDLEVADQDVAAPVATISTQAAETAAGPAEPAKAGVIAAGAPVEPARVEPAASLALDQPVPASPATRRLARELGADLQQLAAANPGVRLTPEHVKAFVRTNLEAGPQAASLSAASPPGMIQAPPLPDFAQWGPIERMPLSALQQRTAANLALAWTLAPQVTQFETAEITALEGLRRRYRDSGDRVVKLTVTAFVLKAVATALQDYPQFNASLDQARNELVLKKYYHIGVAVDTPAGLIVPAVRNVDQKRVLTIAAELEALAERTRQRKVALDELRGGTFTVTNLGGIGGTGFTPIINYPEVAVLGLARAHEEPVVKEGQLSTRLVLPLCLSYDHRVINGADGARFIRKVASLLEDPELLLLEG